jgi:putative spermidine/putrescine transport system permease protein
VSGPLIKRLERRGLGLLSPPLLLLLVAFLLPLLAMLPTSLRPYIPGQGIGTGFTLEHYVKALTDGYYLEIIGRTLALGLIVTLVCLALGYPLAYFLARTQSRWRPWLMLLVVFPLLLNLVVRTFGWIALLANRGLVNDILIGMGLIDTPIKLLFNFSGLLIALSHIFLPFMVLVLVGVIRNLPRDVEDAARTLGAGWLATFVRITLPLSLPGILAGSILVFVLTVSALVTPRLLGGPTYKVMSTLIYDQFLQLLNWPAGAALSFILTAIAVGLISLSSGLARRMGAGT